MDRCFRSIDENAAQKDRGVVRRDRVYRDRGHQIIGGVDDESLKAITSLSEHEGITSFKLFMAYPSDGAVVAR